MKKYILRPGISLSIVTAGIALSSCEKVDEVPPYKESSSTKVYKLPDPTIMTAEETAELKAIKAEYEAAVNNN